jgi:hypothetical protein
MNASSESGEWARTIGEAEAFDIARDATRSKRREARGRERRVARIDPSLERRRVRKTSRVKKKILASTSGSSTIRSGEKKAGEAMAVTSPVNGRT